MINATPKQLRKAANIQEKIQALQNELNSILGGSDEAAIEKPRKRRKVSAAGRARMRAAQQARWAKMKGKAPKKKFSAAGRARLAALAKARWAKVKAAGKSRL